MPTSTQGQKKINLGSPVGELSAQLTEGFYITFDEFNFNPSDFGAIRRSHLPCRGGKKDFH